MRRQDCEVAIRARIIFNEGQQAWFTKCKEKGVKIKDEQLSNVRDGGECNVFELIDILMKTLDKEMLEHLLPRIKPGIYKKSNSKEEKGRFYMDFLLMKICARVAKKGQDIKSLFEIMDKDKSGYLDMKELISGLSYHLGLFFHKEEIAGMYKYLDTDKSGGVDFKEFSSKVNFKEYYNKVGLY